MALARLRTAVAAALLAAAVLAAVAVRESTGQVRDTTTTLLSRSTSGGTPNGASTNGVISGDRRYSQVIAFESEASDLVRGDTNGVKDVFAIKRAGSFGNNGSAWRPGNTILLSRGRGGPANGPSFAPSVDGNFRNRARCVAFLSDASNLVSGDTNDQTDAFLSKGPGSSLTRVSLPSDRQAAGDTTAVAVSGDCSKVAFVTDGRLYVRTGSDTKRLDTRSNPADPSFAAGTTNDLVFGAKGGVYLSRGATKKPSRVAKGRNPAFNNLKRQVIAYERSRGGHFQIAWRDLGKSEQVASDFRSELGNGDSRDPVVVNSGFFIGFESDATNLGTSPSGRRQDENGVTDSYLYTDVRNVTILESVDSDNDQLRGGGSNPSTSYYRNYVVFDSPGSDPNGVPQVYLRYLGGI